MKRKEFLLGLILILGTTISLSAQDMFPLGWWQTRVVSGYTAHPDSVMLAIDSSRVRIHIQVYDNAEFDSICATSRQNDAWMILDRPRKRAYESGGYLSVTTSLLEHYPAQWDYDSLIFWKDLASQLADSLHYVADNYHVYAFHNAYYDGHTHYRRRRLYPGIRYLTERLKIGGDYKTFTYSSWDIKELFDTLDNRNNRGHDIIEYISRTGWYDDSPLPGQSGFQEKLSDFAGGVDQTCKYARSRNMEFWSEFTVWNGETIRYPTRTELWVMANLGLAYGVKGYDFYHFNLGVYYKSEGGDGVLDIEDRPYMTEAQCEAVFGEDVADNDFFNDDATIYYDIRCIADTLLNIVGPDFRKLKHRDGISVLHTDNLQNYFYINEIEADPYSSLSSSQIYFEVAIFEDPVDGYRHFVIVNRLCAAGDSVDYTVDLELPDGTYNIRDLYTDNVVASNLEADDYDLEDFTVRLAPGHAGLYKIEPVDLETVVTLPLDYKKATAYTNGRKIALGPRGRIHVCYTDSSTTTGVRSVWYAYTDNGTSWVKQKIADNAFCSAIAVDDAGAPYVSYLTLTDSKQVIVWSEGESRVMLGQACIPTMSIYPSEDLGIVYSSDKSGFYFMSRRFHLSSLLNYNASTVEKGYAEAINHPSCCFSDSGDAVCIARNISRPNSLAQTATFYPYTDYNAYDDQEMETIYKTYENGNHIEPNLSVQLGELWATFIDGSDIKNRITSSERTSRYQFSNEIKTILQNANATTLQMANGWPFLVFEKEVNGIPKIFFSFQRADGTWSTPDRASENGPSVYERYPHVAIDFNNGIGRIIWTQWNSDGSNTGIGFTFKDIRSDSVYVLYPNGGEVLWLGVDTLTWWWQKEVSATNQPEETTIEITYDYSPSGCDWYEIASGCYEGEYPYPDPERWFDIFLMWLTRWAFECPIWGIHGEDFVPAQVTDEARIRVTADYDGSTAADVSDANFSIIAPLKVVITEVGGGGLKTKPGGGFFSASAITNTAPAKTYERKALFNLKNPTHKTSPTDTSEAPGLLIYMPQDSTEDVVWDALSYTGLNDVILQASYNGGKSYFNEDTSTPGNPVLADSITTLDSTTLYGYFYDGIATWEVPDYPVFEGYLRMMAADTNDVTVYSDPVGPFMIPPDGGNPDMTRLDQRLIGVGTAAGKIAIAYQAKETDTSASIIRYMESDEGLGFNAPESLGTGVYPAMAEGAVVWVSETQDSVSIAGYSGSAWDGTTAKGPKQGATYTKYSPPAIIVDDYDTARAVTLSKAVIYEAPVWLTKYYLDYIKFPKDDPDSDTSVSYQLTPFTKVGVDTTSSLAISLANIGNNLYAGFIIRDTIYYVSGTVTGGFSFSPDTIGPGFSPQVSAYEGNVILSYMKPDSSAIIRLWGYRNDTAWVEKDTIDLSEHGTCMTETKGTLYSIQQTDTTADQFVYDPISEELYLERSYDGFYAHPWLDEEDSTFARVDCYTWEYDSSSYALRTNRKPLNVINPAVYVEADDYRSPYCDFRDTCIHYTSVDVDSGADSLVYVCPVLNSGEKYAVIVEFYTECDSATELEIEVGANLDTIQIAGSSYSWYEQNVATGTDTLELTIRKLSRDGFVPVSRVIVRRRSDSGIFMMGSPGEDMMPLEIPFCLYQPFPNPFGNAATIRYSLPYATHVSLKVYDVSGRLVNNLVDREIQAGIHQLQWTGKDDLNRKCASGVYFVRFAADDYTASKKMVLVK